jgi:glycerol-3-phosphate dehydrogenase
VSVAPEASTHDLAHATQADVVVIGGGVNGTGVARDLALRGLKVVLFERNDLAFGASGNSSGMIHGGARYLAYDASVTATSCKDSGFIQQIAPHLLFRIPFLMPIERGAKGRVMLELVDAYFRAYDDYQPLKRGASHTRLTQEELLAIEPGLAADACGGVTFDEWGTDGARLCTLNAVDAARHGALVHVHTSVEQLASVPGTYAFSKGNPKWLVKAHDRTTGEVHRVATSFVVNATGAWGPLTAALGDEARGSLKVRPGKGIHVYYERRVTNFAIVAKAIDGRQAFLEPWENMTVIGTTDDDYHGNLDRVLPTSEEARYLIDAVARVFPAIRRARAIGTWAGVRPTLYKWGKVEDKLSREHEIVDHAAVGLPGVISLIGGKLASYRLFAEEASDVVAQALGVSRSCQTHLAPLPGGTTVPSAVDLAQEFRVDPIAARRLVFRHGEGAKRILRTLRDDARNAEVVCPCEPVLGAEVRHVVREEFAQTASDVSRRTRLGLGACGGMRCALRCGQIVASERGLSPREGLRQGLELLESQALMRRPILDGEQAQQEALHRAHVRGLLGSEGGDR